MKRTAIFTLTAFYLLLTSGTFVCAVHCSLARLEVQPEMQMAGTPSCSKPCCADKQHNCTKKHGNFSIKENIQPGYSIRMHMPLLTLNYSPYALPYTSQIIQQPSGIISRAGKAPPGSGKLTAITFRSLLI
ncbi:MAG TPA: hypothetical protein VFE53_09930 [Mucilaginibacter sp.]|jgi:hypothetical protein|nr:hypothetical protein [Mucilaginibacter sp.]